MSPSVGMQAKQRCQSLPSWTSPQRLPSEASRRRSKQTHKWPQLASSDVEEEQQLFRDPFPSDQAPHAIPTFAACINHCILLLAARIRGFR